MGKVNKRKISRGGKFNSQMNSVVANSLQPMQNTGIISVVSNNNSNGLAMNTGNLNNLNNVSSTTSVLTSINHPHSTQQQSNTSPNLAASPPQNLLNNSNQTLLSLKQQTANLNNLNNLNNLQTNAIQNQNQSNQLINLQNQINQSSNQIQSNPLLDLQQMNSINNSTCSQDLANQLLVNQSNQFSSVNNLNDNSIQPQHNSKCARLETTSDLNWDLKPNLIKLENDLNGSPTSNTSSNNHSHNSSSSLDSPGNCLLKNQNDLNVKLSGGYPSKSRNSKYELKILKQPEEQHR